MGWLARSSPVGGETPVTSRYPWTQSWVVDGEKRETVWRNRRRIRICDCRTSRTARSRSSTTTRSSNLVGGSISSNRDLTTRRERRERWSSPTAAWMPLMRCWPSTTTKRSSACCFSQLSPANALTARQKPFPSSTRSTSSRTWISSFVATKRDQSRSRCSPSSMLQEMAADEMLRRLRPSDRRSKVAVPGAPAFVWALRIGPFAPNTARSSR